jgi:hypothetical protein
MCLDEVVERCGAARTVLGQLVQTVRAEVEDRERMASAHQPASHVGAHAAQADHC